MATLKDFRDERLRKLDELEKLGLNPYPSKANRTHNIETVIEKFGELENRPVCIVGRITSIRKFGKIAFIVIKDESGSMQLFLQQSESLVLEASSNSLSMNELNLLDSGDFVEAKGNVIKTQSGEISVACVNLRLLTKALRPMPSTVDGFTNKEERMRRRYIDLNVNKDVKDRFKRRSVFWTSVRDYLNKNGFLEINTPVLEHTTGGADAAPFVTHMDALDQDFYLRISHELPLKRLIGGGYEKVYDIGPRFRNENYSDEHLPEHVAMEWYWAYANWQDGMKFMQDMYKVVLEKTFGKLVFDINGHEVDMNKDWQIIDYSSVIKEHFDIDVYESSMDDIKKALVKNKLEVEKVDNRARSIDKLWKSIRGGIAGPAWLINTPKFISPLAKSLSEDERSVERFQAIIAGSELGNGFSELNNPIEQLGRFVEQQAMRKAGDEEAMMLDIDYVEMLEYGMPPTCGWGFSERVFWVFEGVSAREGVPFVHLKTETDEVTKSIYPDLFNKNN